MLEKILVTGADGQVGRELCQLSSPYEVIGFNRQALDITNRDQVQNAMREFQPDIVINAAAYTNVDKAEEETERAYAINCDGVRNLAQSCKSFAIPLMHISTDYVFDGTKNGAYVEDDPIAPLGIYGKSKEAGETALREVLDEHIILRTSWVFSATGNNFVKTMLRLGGERSEIAVVDDQYGCPTSARSIANVLYRFAERYIRDEAVKWDTYHFCNQPGTTWYGFAKKIFSMVSLLGEQSPTSLNSITSVEFPTTAQRPANSELDCAKLLEILQMQIPLWEQELKFVIDEIGFDQ